MTSRIQDRILIVESDPVVGDFIGRQALKAAGYQTYVVADAGTAINRSIQIAPDAIVANLNLPGLSAKDLMVALRSQSIETPVVLVASKGNENAIVQAFRLGAADILLWPVREAEIVNVVERVLKQVRERREREQLSRQLQQTNQELQQRVRELTTIFSIGKAVISITNQSLLFDKIVAGALKVTQADLGWLLLREDTGMPFILAAQKNLPPGLPVRVGESWDDSISSLVAMSGEPLSIYGDPVKRFKIAPLGQAAMVVPLRVQKQVVGLLAVMRKENNPFSASEQNLLEAVVDYASISLVNARLFKAAEGRALALQNKTAGAQLGERLAFDLLQTTQKELRGPLDVTHAAMQRLLKEPAARWSSEQRQLLTVIQGQLQRGRRVVEAIPDPAVFNRAAVSRGPAKRSEKGSLTLNEIIQSAAAEFQHYAQDCEVSLVSEVVDMPLQAAADPIHMWLAVSGLLSNALKFTNQGGRVTACVKPAADGRAQVSITDTGSGLDAREMNRFFEERAAGKPTGAFQTARPRGFGGMGVSLGMVSDIIQHYQGKIWVESQSGKGASFHFTIPASSPKGQP